MAMVKHVNYMLTWLIIAKLPTPEYLANGPPKFSGWGPPPYLPSNIMYSGENSEVDVATNCHSDEHRDEICVRIDHSFAG